MKDGARGAPKMGSQNRPALSHHHPEKETNDGGEDSAGKPLSNESIL